MHQRPQMLQIKIMISRDLDQARINLNSKTEKIRVLLLIIFFVYFI